MWSSASRPGPLVPVFVGLLVLVSVGTGGVSLATAESDKFSDTCVDADTLNPDDRPWDSFGEGDRDVFHLDLDQGQQATIEVTYTVSGSSRLVVFGVNQYIMTRDVGGSMGDFEIEESAHPKYYYHHGPDVSISLNDSIETQFREADSGDTLNARHLVTGYPLEQGTHQFTFKPETDHPVCLVLRTDSNGGGSWILDYSKEKTDEAVSQEERILTLRKTVERQKTRIAELEGNDGGADGMTDSNGTTNESASGNDTAADSGDNPAARTVMVTPAGGSSGILGMDIPLLWVLGLLAIGVLIARKL